MMVMVFFLFIFSGAAKIALSNFKINEYDFDRSKLQIRNTSEVDEASLRGTVLFYGSSEKMLHMAQQWCSYRRYALSTMPAEDGETEEFSSYSLVLIDGASLNEESLEDVYAFADAHIPLVFASVPSVKLLRENSKLSQLLGITNIQEASITLDGMTLYENFLMGGKVIYQVTESDIKSDKNAKKRQDLNLQIPWFILNSGSKVYMDGILPEGYEDLDAAYKPPVIWRYMTPNDTVFVVNNNFMESDIGLGMLTAMEGELSDFYVYPVVNAQSIVALNYPTFTEENTERLHEIYSRDSTAVLRDLVWPGIAAVSAHNQSYPSVCFTSKLDYSVSAHPNGELLQYYLQLLRELHGEAGISMVPWKGKSVEEKLAYDKQIYDAYAKEYTMLFAYAKDLDAEEAAKMLDTSGFDDVFTILCDYDATDSMIGAIDGKLVLQISNEGSSHTFSEDLRTKSFQTVLGYSVIGQDFAQIVYPENKNDQWEKVYDRFSRYTNTYWKNYDYYDELTLSETAQRCNRYFQLEYDLKIQGERISIQSNASEEHPAYFVVQTGARTIQDMTGGTYELINDGRYLITLTDSKAVIDCSNKEQLTFWR